MKKLGLVTVAVAAFALAAFASAALAMEPATYSFDISRTYYAPFTSAHCGIPVYITADGSVEITLFYDQDGNVVREIDRAPGFTDTFFSPATGQSFTVHSPFVAMYDYGAGATLGGPATITLVGTEGDAGGPGTAVTAGRVVIPGVVIGFSPEGIPLVDPAGEPTSQSGTFPDFLTVGLPERCAALGGSVQ